MGKVASRKIFWQVLHSNFFMFVSLISNYTVFLVQFRINLHEEFFKKAEIVKNSVVQINFIFNSKPYDYLY